MDRTSMIDQFLGEWRLQDDAQVACTNCGRMTELGISDDEEGNPNCGEC